MKQLKNKEQKTVKLYGITVTGKILESCFESTCCRNKSGNLYISESYEAIMQEDYVKIQCIDGSYCLLIK